MPPEFVINEAAILELVSDTSNGVAREIERQAQRVVVKAQDNLSNPYPPSGIPPGPPHLRTGRLRASIHALPVELGHDGIFVEVIADAIGEHGWLYGTLLRERGYTFITDTDLELLKE